METTWKFNELTPEDKPMELKIDSDRLYSFFKHLGGNYSNNKIDVPEELYNDFKLRLFGGTEFLKKNKSRFKNQVKDIRYVVRREELNNLVALGLFYHTVFFNTFKTNNVKERLIETHEMQKDLKNIQTFFETLIKKDIEGASGCNIYTKKDAHPLNIKSKYVLEGILRYLVKWVKPTEEYLKHDDYMKDRLRNVDFDFEKAGINIGRGSSKFNNEYLKDLTWHLMIYLTQNRVIDGEFELSKYLNLIADFYTLIKLPDLPGKYEGNKSAVVWNYASPAYDKNRQIARIRSILEHGAPDLPGVEEVIISPKKSKKQ